MVYRQGKNLSSWYLVIAHFINVKSTTYQVNLEEKNPSKKFYENEILPSITCFPYGKSHARTYNKTCQEPNQHLQLIRSNPPSIKYVFSYGYIGRNVDFLTNEGP